MKEATKSYIGYRVEGLTVEATKKDAKAPYLMIDNQTFAKAIFVLVTESPSNVNAEKAAAIVADMLESESPDDVAITITGVYGERVETDNYPMSVGINVGDSVLLAVVTLGDLRAQKDRIDALQQIATTSLHLTQADCLLKHPPKLETDGSEKKGRKSASVAVKPQF